MRPDLNSPEERQDTEISEDSLRLALERLGAKQPRRSSSPTQSKTGSDPRRRRFVQEGQVVVEHHQTSRTSQRVASVQNDDQGEEIARLRNLLKLEQRRAEDAQRYLNDAQVQLRTLETHLVHEKLHTKEIKTRCSEAEQALLEAQAQLIQLREAMAHRKSPAVRSVDESAEATIVKPRRPGRPPKPRPVVETSEEPEPIQWWKD